MRVVYPLRLQYGFSMNRINNYLLYSKSLNSLTREK